ncbi:guanylate-binding protein 3-like [Leptodactylus fuscus]|uniref:guanylate-binding protein 3-like n=1 Tax=Leptodactylus fuscus TaxID=238119 RepID=UPI003F4EF0D0
MAPIPKISEAICLIENNGDSLSVKEEAKKILENISQPLVVVSIVGPYLSGKSYLMNKLSGDSKCGFSLGHTYDAKTKGIWMQCVPHPNKSGHTLILLDTEGTGNVTKGNVQNDHMILSLAMLMSSAVIYNSTTAINQDAVKKLYSMTETHQDITHRASKQNGQDVPTKDQDPMLPILVWTLRDVTLKLEMNGQPVTADEYLEKSLQDITSAKTPRTKEQNRARKTIRDFFPQRKCFVFDLPSSDKAILSMMDQVSEDKLQSRFVEETKDFCQFILEKVPPKQLKGGTPVTGSRFAYLLQSYLDVVKNHDIGFLDSSMSAMFVNENRKEIQRSIESYENKMLSRHVNNHEEFQQAHKATVEEIMQDFKKLCVKHEKSLEEYKEELKNGLQNKKDEIWKKCEETSEQSCKEIMEKLKSNLVQNIKGKKYHVAGGHKIFVTDRDSIIQEYDQKQDKGVKAEDVRQQFLSSLEDVEKIILKTDQEMSASKPMIFQLTDKSDPTQLSQYIQSYRLPAGPFSRILIQLFGFAGHGKSSFVNSCLYASGSGRFHDYAGEAACLGGKTIDRRGYKLTENITIVDNRGFSTMDSAQEWEIYAQLSNCVPLNEFVTWGKSQDERVNLVIKRANEDTTDVIVPVLIYSSQQSLNGEEHENIKKFLKQAHSITRILPFVVLTKSKMGNGASLKDKFLKMGMEKVYCIENYTMSDQLAIRSKHLNILTILYDILDYANYHLNTKSNALNKQEIASILMNKVRMIN